MRPTVPSAGDLGLQLLLAGQFIFLVQGRQQKQRDGPRQNSISVCRSNQSRHIVQCNERSSPDMVKLTDVFQNFPIFQNFYKSFYRATSPNLFFFPVSDVYQQFSLAVTSQPVDGGQTAIFSRGQSLLPVQQINATRRTGCQSPIAHEMHFPYRNGALSSVATSFLFWPNMNKIPLIYWFHSKASVQRRIRAAGNVRSIVARSAARHLSRPHRCQKCTQKYSKILLANFTAFCGGRLDRRLPASCCFVYRIFSKKCG